MKYLITFSYSVFPQQIAAVLSATFPYLYTSHDVESTIAPTALPISLAQYAVALMHYTIPKGNRTATGDGGGGRTDIRGCEEKKHPSLLTILFHVSPSYFFIRGSSRFGNYFGDSVWFGYDLFLCLFFVVGCCGFFSPIFSYLRTGLKEGTCT